MDSSRRAVESYWRSRMIDGATFDEDKVTPVYKLEEICDLLRSSHSSIVKEVSEFILKRLDHKSPIVKQKGLRVIKYAVGKSGVEFRREMQRNSVAVRQLIHYKGQLDPLKGDALNKAVRATAQEALSAIFSTEENNKTMTSAAASPPENLTKRIQGFGNTNYEMTSSSSEDKKSFLSEVVGIGSATIKQGLNSLTQSPSIKKNDTGSYRSPNLRRSLTTDIDQSDQPATRFSNNSTAGTWARNYETSQTETSNNYNNSNNNVNYNNNNSREERLLETIVTSGGVRLQPTRDAIHAFLREVPKLDALVLSHALESKLKSHLWQVRVKAVCVLEAILRNKDEENLAIIASYFSENKDVMVKCSESPQASLREKANKVLSLLDSGKDTGIKAVKTEENTTNSGNLVQLPDLIDTGDSNDSYYESSGVNKNTNQIDDLFGCADISSEQKNDENDPFADVSFHINNEKQHQQQEDSLSAVDPFIGLNLDDKPVKNNNGPQIFDDIFGSTLEQKEDHKGDINDLMGNINISMNTTNESSVNIGQPQSNPMFPMAYNLPAGMMFNPITNYGAMGNIFGHQQQQQFLATMSNFHSQNPAVTSAAGGYISALPDIFNPTVPNQSPNSTTMNNSSKKEDTRAFDFISDHLAAARDPKRVI